MKRKFETGTSSGAKRSKAGAGGRRKKPMYKLRKGGSKALVKAVASVLERKIEKKYINAQLLESTVVAYNNTVGGASPGPWQARIFPLTPYSGGNAYDLTVAQGTGDGARIGNRITTHKLMFRGVFHPLKYDATTNTTPQPCDIRMIIFYDKLNSATVPGPSTDFMKTTGSSAAPTSNAMDMLTPINTDRYGVFYDNIYRVGYENYLGVAAGANQPNQQFTNNDYKFTNRFDLDLTKYCPKHFQFNDNSTSPSTRGLFVCFLLNAVAVGTMTANQVYANISYNLDYSFSDA